MSNLHKIVRIYCVTVLAIIIAAAALSVTAASASSSPGAARGQAAPGQAAPGPADRLLLLSAFRSGGLHLAIRPFSNDAQATNGVPHGESRFRLCRSQEVDVRWHESHRYLALDLNDEAQGRTTR